MESRRNVGTSEAVTAHTGFLSFQSLALCAKNSSEVEHAGRDKSSCGKTNQDRTRLAIRFTTVKET